MAEEEKETAVQAKSKMKAIGEFIQTKREVIAGLIPKHLDPEKMLRIAQVAVSRNPKLAECTALSILDVVIKASQVGWELNGPLRHAAMVPFWNGQTKKLEAQLIPMYPGLIDLCYRSGAVSYVDAHPILEGDFFEYEYGTNQHLTHRPRLTNQGELIGAYAITRFKDGTFMFEVMGASKIEEIRQRSKAKDAGPWVTDTDEMYRKTPLKRLLKRVPNSPEVQKVLTYDDQAETGKAQDSLVDFDFESAEMRGATEEKTEALKEKLEEAKERSKPKLVTQDKPKVESKAKTQEASEILSETILDEKNAIQDELPGLVVDPKGEEIISEQERKAFIAILVNENGKGKVPDIIPKGWLNMRGYSKTNQIKRKHYNELMELAKAEAAKVDAAKAAEL